MAGWQMTGFICDHAASRKSLDTFVESTLIIGVQTDGKEFLLLGRCKACDSTLAIEITTPRGCVKRGEIGAVPSPILTEITPAGLRAFGEADARAKAVPGQDVIEGETADDHARRVIR